MPTDTTIRHAQPPRDRAWLFSLLIAPSGVLGNGVIQGGVLGYLLSLQAVDSGTQAHLIGLLSLPTSLYFLWSPITDFFIRRRSWLLVGALTAALLTLLAFRQPQLSSQGALILMLIGACCSQLVVSSAGGMMGALHSEQTRRRAGSFYQAGSAGFGALSAWALIYLSSRVTRDTLGLIVAALIAIPALFALAAPRQEQISEHSFGLTLRRIWGECRDTFWRWDALPYVACMTLPIASGAATGLLPGVAIQYGVSGDNVALINGLVGGIVTAIGAGGMSLLRTRMRAPVLYCVVGLVNCACLAILWLGPMNGATYFLGVLLYNLSLGACLAMFTAVVLEFLGEAGKSGSARYSIINSLGNIPVLYMLQVDGWGGDHGGARGIAAAETVVGAIGAVALLAYFLIRRPARTHLTGEVRPLEG
jgi:MFS transporter, PAT family, beta-lactamase induction signal transducer AmpG